jgi:phosphoribosylformimino-5-aminoimidazole carboxamide ribotide isomerase
VAAWLSRFGPERLTIALDTRWRDGAWQLPHAGWTELAGATLEVLAPAFANAGAIHVLCTDIDRDGMMGGPNLALYQSLAALAPGLKVQASGGVRSAADVAAVAAAGIAGVIVGRALLQGSLALADAFAAANGAEA